MAAERDLFDEALIPGLSSAQGLITPEEERALIRAIDAAQLRPFQFHGWEGKRLTCSYGWRYDFDDASFTRADPIPDWLEPVRVKAARFAGLEPGNFEQALVIRYDPGAGIGWHRDRPLFDEVVGISLGAPATLRFRRRKAGAFERRSLRLEPRSIYHLTGEVRHQWEHSIAPMAERRWSATFRSLSEKGRHAARHER